jgi:hypothetical protein
MQIGNLENGEALEFGGKPFDLDCLADNIYVIVVVDYVIDHNDEEYLTEDYQEKQQ